MQALKLNIHGKVQGVGYRRWFGQQALLLSLKGYVRNLENGTVEAVVLGPIAELEKMVQLSFEGPLFADVSIIEQTELNPSEQIYTDFKVLR